MLLSKSLKTGTALHPLGTLTHFRARRLRGLIGLAFAALFIATPALSADHGTIVREAIIYISPDSSSHKLAQAERGREVILLAKSRNWIQVEALLGYVNAPDSAFVYDDDDENRKTVS